MILNNNNDNRTDAVFHRKTAFLYVGNWEVRLLTGNPYLSVQALTKYVKRKFDADPHLRNVYVKGNYRM